MSVIIYGLLLHGIMIMVWVFRKYHTYSNHYCHRNYAVIKLTSLRHVTWLWQERVKVVRVKTVATTSDLLLSPEYQTGVQVGYGSSAFCSHDR